MVFCFSVTFFVNIFMRWSTHTWYAIKKCLNLLVIKHEKSEWEMGPLSLLPPCSVTQWANTETWDGLRYPLRVNFAVHYKSQRALLQQTPLWQNDSKCPHWYCLGNFRIVYHLGTNQTRTVGSFPSSTSIKIKSYKWGSKTSTTSTKTTSPYSSNRLTFQVITNLGHKKWYFFRIFQTNIEIRTCHGHMVEPGSEQISKIFSLIAEPKSSNGLRSWMEMIAKRFPQLSMLVDHPVTFA